MPQSRFVSTNIRYIRKEMHLTQETFGMLFSCSRGNIDSYESGRVRPSVEMLNKIATHTGLSVDALTERDLSLTGSKFSPVPIGRQAATAISLDNSELLRMKDELINSLKNQLQMQQTVIDAQRETIAALSAKKQRA